MAEYNRNMHNNTVEIPNFKYEIIMVSNQNQALWTGQKSESVNHLRTGVVCESVDPLQHGHTLALVLADGSERVEKTAGHHLPETHIPRLKTFHRWMT